jgi:hypothetical protein
MTLDTAKKTMKAVNYLLLLTCLFWGARGACAAETDATAAAGAAKGWLQMDGKPFGLLLGNQVKSVETFKDAAGKALYHVVYLKPAGFVIVAGDDGVEPVIAVVKQGRFDPSAKNPLGAMISRDLPVRVGHARAKAATAAGLKHQSEWQALQQAALDGAQGKGLPTGAITDLRVAPIVQTLWSQATDDGSTNGAACYNFFTPPFAAGNAANYVCGCVATAMAQLMRYFQYPTTGVGTPSYTITLTTPAGGTHTLSRSLRGGDGNGGPYAWGSMVLDPSVGATLGQRGAIGALTADAGVAAHMSYAPDGSGTTLLDAKNALVETFKYNNAVVVGSDSLNVGFDFGGMVNANLDARLPVLFGIDNPTGAHAVVCDGYGYDGFLTLYHHLNMGWAGLDDAWYALPIIDLDDTVPYINIDSCLYNVFASVSGEIISGRVLDAGGAPVAGAGVTGVASGGNIYTATSDAKGIYALVGLPSASAVTITVTSAGYYPVSSNCTTRTSMDFATKSGNIWGANFKLIPAQGPPVIATQPQDQTVTVGTNASFSLEAGGQLPLVYQWQYQPRGSLDWADVSNGAVFSGATTPTLVVRQTDTNMDGEPFRCVVSNAVAAVTSSQAILNVTVAPFLPIMTIAGTAGTNGSADGTNALFYNPHGIAVDNNTNIYVADMYNHVIRKITPLGTTWDVSTIAGLAGSSGSADGLNQTARFSSPYGVAVDAAGNVYVADTGNSTIRQITRSGTNWVVSTLCGSAGNTGSVNGSGSAASFRYPTGLAADGAGNIFVADEGNSIIRKLTPTGSTWTATTIAGLAGSFGSADGTNGAARFGEPYGVTVDQGGVVYVVDKYSDTIRKLTPAGANWVVTTIAGLVGIAGSSDGIGNGARFNSPTGIAAGRDGNLYVADQGNNTIRRVSPAGAYWMVFTIAGVPGSAGYADGVGADARFNGPFGIAVDASTNIYVSDALNSTIRMNPVVTAPVPSFVRLMKQRSGSSLTLAWSAMAGHPYRVQYKTSLSQAGWTDCDYVIPTTWTGLATLPTGPDSRRFYRVIPVQ